MQKAVEENKIVREKELEMEKRKQELKEHPTKKQKPSQSKSAPPQEREEVDFRQELKQRSQAINVAPLEGRFGGKLAVKPSPQQHDFRYILKPPRQTAVEPHTRVDMQHRQASGRNQSASTGGDREYHQIIGDQGRFRHRSQLPSGAPGGGIAAVSQLGEEDFPAHQQTEHTAVMNGRHQHHHQQEYYSCRSGTEVIGHMRPMPASSRVGNQHQQSHEGEFRYYDDFETQF